MKFSTALAVLAATATVGASFIDTNANRMARGLPPKAPARRSTPVSRARRSQPSGSPDNGGQCNTGPTHCCNSVEKASSPSASGLLGLVGAVVGADTNVGLTCSPLSAVGISSNSCSQQPVCCNGNDYEGLIVIACSPININL